MRIVLSIFIVFLSSVLVQAQQQITLSGKSLFELKQMNKQNPASKLIASPSFYFSTLKNDGSETHSVMAKPVHLVYAYKDLAPFCKLEVKMEKVVKMPVKFRLGSVDYVDWLEGKRNSY